MHGNSVLNEAWAVKAHIQTITTEMLEGTPAVSPHHHKPPARDLTPYCHSVYFVTLYYHNNNNSRLCVSMSFDTTNSL